MGPEWETGMGICAKACVGRDDSSLVPRPRKRGLVFTVCACADIPLFRGASETTVMWSVFHDRTLLKHAGRYILVENDGGQFRENCVWTSRVVRPQ